MKQILQHILTLLVTLMAYTNMYAQTVTNVEARQEGQNIVITFNMEKPCNPTILYSLTGKQGQYQKIPEQYLQKITMQGTAYKYEWKVLEQFDEFVFDNVCFLIETMPQGAVSGEFSVSPTKKVYFSRGNLQYQASTSTWRFAEHQYDVVGYANKNISHYYKGWIDLFGWGTSGYNGKAPYMTSSSYNIASNIDYGNGSNDISATNYDWGMYNKISNGGNQVGIWHALTISEWEFLIYRRTNANGKYGIGSVNGVDGLILLPDSWQQPTGVEFESGEKGWSQNKYTATKWSKMEANGAVFLPVAGRRYGTEVSLVGGSYGCYWSSCACGNFNAYTLYFASYGIGTSNDPRNYGLSVRLVQDVK